MADINNINNRTIVYNNILQNAGISLKAKGLYCVISSILNGKETLNKEEIRNLCCVGIESFDNAWKELKRVGVLKQYRTSGGKNRFSYKYSLSNDIEVSIKKNKINYNHALTKKIKKKFNYTCQRCGEIEKTKSFHAHHIIPRNTQKYVNDENNLVLLCPECHKWVHSKLNINKEYIG